MAEERKMCPDCDKGATLILPDQGNGECGTCHGTGEHSDILGELIDGLSFNKSDNTCSDCSGTGQCQTCGGEGYVYEDD